ncbi:MAG: mannose-1-phosphate guanylyltransferase [Eubacteriales bacterium]
MRTYSVIMAGGGGTRFWPLSRKELPKQFLNLSGKDSMINETIDRLSSFTDTEDIYVVTNQAHEDYTAEITFGKMEKEHILGEPAARNTAACIGYAAMEILKKRGDGIMCIVPSDHFIENQIEFKRVMERAVAVVKETDQLVTIGIKPTFPSTGYGYIHAEKEEGQDFSKVIEFVEKPDLDCAKAYLETGKFAWNSGMFIWKASTILQYFKELLPDIYRCLEEIGTAMNTDQEKAVLNKVYPVIPKISIDYGIMERAKGVVMLEGDFGWNDVGSFDALENIYTPDEKNNIAQGLHIDIDSKNCIFYGKNKLIATIGLEDTIVVESEDAILVCAKDKAQQVKDIVSMLEEKGMEKYL